MPKKPPLLYLVLVVLIGFSACKTEKNPEELLIGNWINSDTTKLPDQSLQRYGKWQFSTDQSFTLKHSDGSTTKGRWEISSGPILIMQQQAEHLHIAVDSTAISLENGKAVTRYFSKGTQVAQNEEGKTTFPDVTTEFRITALKNGSLTLSNNNLNLRLQPIQTGYGTLHFDLNSFLRGLLGIGILVLICFVLSVNRKAINWRLVASGILIQIVFAILVFKVPFVKSIFEVLAGFFVVVLDFTKEGSNFLFGGLLNTNTVGFLFAFQVLPTIIFFSALTSLLYYLGVLQRVVYGIAWVMSKTMKLSGAESLSTAANIFLGQTEAPLLVKPYLSSMTRSEILCIMIGGMATIAGGVLAAYVGFLGGPDPEQQKIFATHLLTASILSAPAAIVASKMLIPETEEVTEKLELGKEKLGSNFLEAIAYGTSDGIKLAINVGAMLLVFTAFIAMINFIIQNGIGEWTGLNQSVREHSGGKLSGLSFQLILGYVFSPFAWMIGVPLEDMLTAGQLLGEKTVLNEFFAYSSLAGLKEKGAFVHPESIIILTYALCGFSNFASIGIQIGGIGTLAPNQKTTLSQLGFTALIGGTIACFMTACIAGMFF